MKKKIFFSLAVFLLVFSAASIVKASGNVSGWLWGGGTEVDGSAPWLGNNTNLGWISMNSANQGGSIDYGVDIPAGDGNVTGYAWSENLGWVSFTVADLAGCPSAPCTTRRVGDGLHGWARIMCIPQAGANAGGWEGWISMSGIATDGSTYGVDITKMDGTGNNPTYAWSDELGWIDFSRASMGPVVPPVNNLKICKDSCSTGSLIADGSVVTMVTGSSIDLKACYNSSSACDNSEGDVTASANWNDDNTPNDAVSLSDPGSNPCVMTANGAGSENVNASYSGDSTSFTASVTEVYQCKVCDDENRCSLKTFLIPCSDDCALDSDCKAASNWREVAP